MKKEDVEAAFEEAVKKDRYCGIGKVIAEHEHGEVIRAKVEDEVHYSAAVISRVLKSLGVGVVSSNLINTHRKGACRCVNES